MKIVVVGCTHGELEIVYDRIKHLEEKENIKIDLLLCCGDFQATRNPEDLKSMAVPAKYQSMCSFYKYYSGVKSAPILTIFIGGNHEASNHLQELPYGGWAAPNIYYMGYSNVINIAGIRIGGLSGIYNGDDYRKGRFEKPPYTEDTKRSVYHTRNLDVFRMKQLQKPLDIFLTHDWPRGIHKYGNIANLLKKKPFFRDDIESNSLGSEPAGELLHFLKPKYWFSAHLHVNFSATVRHKSESVEKKITTFFALNKCLPQRKFLQLFDIPHDTSKPVELEYDLEWLTILHSTNHLISTKGEDNFMPGPKSRGRWVFTPTQDELNFIKEKFADDFKVPKNFTQTTDTFTGSMSDSNNNNVGPLSVQFNPQTTVFCDQLGISDPIALLLRTSHNTSLNSSSFSLKTLPGDLTPERSGDLTQVSFSLDESSDMIGQGDVLELTSHQSSPLVKNNTSTPLSMKRISLVLPTPLNDSAGYCKPDEEEVDSSKQFGDLSTSQDRETDTNNRCNEETASSNVLELSPIRKLDTGLTEEDEDKTQPKVKKFRRRNQELYASAGPDPQDEETEIISHDTRDKYDISKIISFPGFNVPVNVPGIKDEAKFYRCPPMMNEHSKQAMVSSLQSKETRAYKRKRLSLETPKKPEPLGELLAIPSDMEVEEVAETVSMLPDDNCRFIPPLPKDTPPRQPPPPSTTESDSEGAECRSQEPCSPLSTGHSSISSPRAQSPSLSDLEAKKRQLLAELEDGGSSSDNAVNQKNPPTPSTPNLGRVKSVSLGTPLLKSASPYNRLPDSDKFSKNICDVINFENLPDATGKYEQMTGLIKKVRVAVAKIQNE